MKGAEEDGPELGGELFGAGGGRDSSGFQSGKGIGHEIAQGAGHGFAAAGKGVAEKVAEGEFVGGATQGFGAADEF